MIKTRKNTNKKKVVLQKGQNIPKDAIDKYFIANTAEIFVPDKVVNIANDGKIKLVDTLTKNKSIKKIKGKPVIKLEDKNMNGIIIHRYGEKLMDKGRKIDDAMEYELEDKARTLVKKMNTIKRELDALKDNKKNKEKIDELKKQHDILKIKLIKLENLTRSPGTH